jgi:GxxExxY protein
MQETDLKERRERLDGTTERTIGCVFKVCHELGNGFLERVYENSLAHELRKSGLKVEQQHPIEVRYDGVVVGEFVADRLVEGEVVIELKVAKALDDNHKAQCINYLKATGLPVCLLVSFGAPKAEIKRIVLGPLFSARE